ncbi:MAG: hypothetical protein ABGZ17_14670, partial [Planctomycetaceae bacterium]
SHDQSPVFEDGTIGHHLQIVRTGFAHVLILYCPVTDQQHAGQTGSSIAEAVARDVFRPLNLQADILSYSRYSPRDMSCTAVGQPDSRLTYSI